MPFQFMCPQGHLLEGAESQMGQQSQCPLCGATFVVPFVNPQPGAAPAYQHGHPPAGGGGQYGAPAYSAPGYGAVPYPGQVQPPAGYPGVNPAGGYPAPPGQYPTQSPFEYPFSPAPGAIPSYPQVEAAQPFIPAPEVVISVPAEAAAAAAPAPPAEPPPEERVVRILCPNSHELHTPMDMIGQDAMCPECGSQFRLRYEDSLEHAEEKRAAQAKRDEAFNKAALKWSIIAAVVVFLAIVIMMAMRAMNK